LECNLLVELSLDIEERSHFVSLGLWKHPLARGTEAIRSELGVVGLHVLELSNQVVGAEFVENARVDHPHLNAVYAHVEPEQGEEAVAHHSEAHLTENVAAIF